MLQNILPVCRFCGQTITGDAQTVERIGIGPDIGILEGRDEVVEKAISVIDGR